MSLAEFISDPAQWVNKRLPAFEATVIRNKLFGEQDGIVPKAINADIGNVHIVAGQDKNSVFGEISIRF